MRNIKHIVVHCTATPQDTTIESIKKYWKEVRGWGDTPGYHYIIRKDGEIIQLLNESKISNGSFGHNADCVHVAYIGGVDKNGLPVDNRTGAQKDAMHDKLVELSAKYPQAEILGHRDFPGVYKACPSFDVKKWLKEFIPKELRAQHEEDEE
jgi:N-acetylmuramoyl-L-alanine amidase